ncbi:MAG: hypothetical protein F6J87_08470 [Spirulina sp. SIO3F2]|nr:hypothetical protein [Spirulina sp. SIO3F2]
MKPRFSTLIFLTFLTALLLLPFVFSPQYIAQLRQNHFELHLIFQSEIYKQITGYSALFFVVLEMIFTARKRGRGWWLKIKVPGSMNFWRSLHIFLGVALLGVTLIHTVGVQGLNYNAVFLWVFFGVTLSALVGVVAETGILESPRRYFGWLPADGSGQGIPALYKGPLIRNLRSLWLATHIILVCIFFVMLVGHIFLAYYFR